jgi:HPt (histidine-containing phosphotransfer) domain-containing protein
MNEHVGKPFDLDNLVHTLLRVTGFKPVQALPAEVQEPVPVAPEALASVPVEVPGVDVAGAVARMGGMSELYLRLAHQFLDTLTPELSALQTALSGERVQATRQAHSLKGTAAVLGATQLSQAAAELEKQCKSEAAEGELRATWLRVESVARQTADQLMAALRHLEGNPPEANDTLAPHADVQAVARAMAELRPLLEADDFAALEKFAGLRADLAELPDDLLSPLEEAMQDLDMERALAACGAIDDWTKSCLPQT